MISPEIEPRSPRPFVNILSIMPMFRCIYKCIYEYECVCAFIYIYIYMYINIYTYMCVCIYIYIYMLYIDL